MASVPLPVNSSSSSMPTTSKMPSPALLQQPVIATTSAFSAANISKGQLELSVIITDPQMIITGPSVTVTDSWISMISMWVQAQ